MQQLLLILHVLVCMALIALVLIQHGKGADVGASFGSGASNTMFGSAGSTPFLVKVTGSLAAIFFLTSLGLSYSVSRHAHHAVNVAPIEKQLPASSVPSSEKPVPSTPQTPN